jgi:WD40 repeat protein
MKKVRVWNYENGSCVRTLSGHTDWVFSVKVCVEEDRVKLGFNKM